MTRLPSNCPTEHQEQVEVIDWARGWEPTYEALDLLHAIPNGGFRSKRTAAKLVREGVTRGIPDLFLPWPSRGFHGLYVEMKSLKGKLSDSQKKVIPRLIDRGYCVAVCKGAEEAKRDICWYLAFDEKTVRRLLSSYPPLSFPELV